ncbi:MAG: LysM peptidoglycan-binding domain-containing protein [Candidatus Nealsonbacteria bacterium]|nr:LysM peptidoglycan-binding domain-containing protein [Candidatus Nealsonbacteria bacterium]
MESLLGLPQILRKRWLKRAIRGLKKSKIRILRDFKGSSRDPLFYLGTLAVILFGFIAVLAPATVNSPLLAEDALSLRGAFIIPAEKIQESPDLSIIQGNSLAAVSPPILVTPQVLGALVGGGDFSWQEKEVVEYEIQPGDNLWSIAEKFNVSLETILWANNLNKNSLIQIGQKLVILPVSGISHQVGRGDTVSRIAQTYKTKIDDIIAFNDLSGEGDIYIGDILIIPNGVQPPPVIYAPKLVPLASSYFLCPISEPCRVTQGLHWYNAIDFSHGKCGDPIYAAAAGTIQKVKLTNSTSRWAFGGGGNHLTILHPNGVVTYYGHLQAALVNPGDYISQGQMIAIMGGQPGTPGAGKSTACHVHFGVTGAKNPFAK